MRLLRCTDNPRGLEAANAVRSKVADDRSKPECMSKEGMPNVVMVFSAYLPRLRSSLSSQKIY